MLVHDRVALITGAGSGLGLATLQRLSRAGARVVALDVDDARAGVAVAGIDPERAMSAAADVTDGEGTAAVVDRVVDRFGALHICVSCAGIATAEKVISHGQPARLEGFARTVAVNLVGTFNVVRLAAAAMSANQPDESGERGVIVNTSSGAAYDGQVGQSAYSASKAGVAGMTLPLARDLAGKGIRVNAIAPGLFDTSMVAGMPDSVRGRLVEMILEPPRMGSPEEFAALVEHVVINGYLNAECIRLDAGTRMSAR